MVLRASPAAALEAGAGDTNDSAVHVLGDDAVGEIARELVAEADWTPHHRCAGRSVRAE